MKPCKQKAKPLQAKPKPKIAGQKRKCAGEIVEKLKMKLEILEQTEKRCYPDKIIISNPWNPASTLKARDEEVQKEDMKTGEQQGVIEEVKDPSSPVKANEDAKLDVEAVNSPKLSNLCDIRSPKDIKHDEMMQLMKEYGPNNIFSADEIGIFYNCLPSNMDEYNDNCVDGENSEDRITVLLGTNVSGTDKLNLLVIGKHQDPKSFDGIDNLPVDYAGNSKVWMTKEIFEDWLRNLDRDFSDQERKVLMYVRRCPPHCEVNNLSAIKIEFLPCSCKSDAFSIKPPIMEGIKECFKRFYRLGLLQKVSSSVELGKTYNMNLLQTVYLLDAAWSSVSQSVISSSFVRAGFTMSDNNVVSVDTLKPSLSIKLENPKWSRSLPKLGIDLNTSVDVYANFDNEVATCAEINHIQCILPELASCEVPMDQDFPGFDQSVEFNADFDGRLNELSESLGLEVGAFENVEIFASSSSSSSDSSDEPSKNEIMFSGLFQKKYRPGVVEADWKAIVSDKMSSDSESDDEPSREATPVPKTNIIKAIAKEKVVILECEEIETAVSNEKTFLNANDEDVSVPTHVEAQAALKTLQSYLSRYDKEGVLVENFMEINRFIECNISD